MNEIRRFAIRWSTHTRWCIYMQPPPAHATLSPPCSPVRACADCKTRRSSTHLHPQRDTVAEEMVACSSTGMRNDVRIMVNFVQREPDCGSEDVSDAYSSSSPRRVKLRGRGRHGYGDAVHRLCTHAFLGFRSLNPMLGPKPPARLSVLRCSCS